MLAAGSTNRQQLAVRYAWGQNQWKHLSMSPRKKSARRVGDRRSVRVLVEISLCVRRWANETAKWAKVSQPKCWYGIKRHCCLQL